MQNISNFVCDYMETASLHSHPQHFSDNELGKKLWFYYSVLFLFFLIQRWQYSRWDWRDTRFRKNHVRNFENMGFRFMLYVNIACTTDQCILPEENVPTIYELM